MKDILEIKAIMNVQNVLALSFLDYKLLLDYLFWTWLSVIELNFSKNDENIFNKLSLLGVRKGKWTYICEFNFFFSFNKNNGLFSSRKNIVSSRNGLFHHSYCIPNIVKFQEWHLTFVIVHAVLRYGEHHLSNVHNLCSFWPKHAY